MIDPAHYPTVVTFSNAIDAKRDAYNHHGHKVHKTVSTLLKFMTHPFTDADFKILEYASQLHDIGKLFLDSDLIAYPGRLNHSQMLTMQQHTEQGFHLVHELQFHPIICDVVHYHHENMDGSGYPAGLRGTKIPLVARIIRVADTYEAFTSDRAYRRAGKPKDIIQIMNAEADKIFDASVVTALQKALESKGIL